MRSEQDEPTVVTAARAILAGQRHPDDFDAAFDEATVLGFHVDLDALEGAARDIRDTIRDRNSIDVRDICGAAELYGHAGLHGAFSDFCARWSEGIDLLVGDAGIIGESLLAAESYRSVDEAGSSAFDPGVSSR